MTVAWVFPGQGSQKIGMAKQIENLPNTKERFSYASEIFERNLFEICELNTEPTNPLSDLNNTRNTQICLFLVESILLDALKENGFKPTYVAGHSLGRNHCTILCGCFFIRRLCFSNKRKVSINGKCWERIYGSSNWF